MYVSPQTQSLIFRNFPAGFTLAGLAMMPFQPQIGGPLILIGVIGQTATGWLSQSWNKNPRSLDSLDKRLKPLNQLLQILPDFYSDSWKGGYESDYSLLSNTIQSTEEWLKSSILNAQSEALHLAHLVKNYNTIFEKTHPLLNKEQLEQCRLSVKKELDTLLSDNFLKLQASELKPLFRQALNDIKKVKASLEDAVKNAQELDETAVNDDLAWIVNKISNQADKYEERLPKVIKQLKLLAKVKTVKEQLDSGIF